MFARMFFPLVAWITFLALWVRGATYGFSLVLGVPEEVGAYIFGFVPLGLALFIHLKRWHPDYEFHVYFAGNASAGAVAGAAHYFLHPYHGQSIHLLLGGIGFLFVLVSSYLITWTFIDFPSPGESLTMHMTTCFGGLVMTAGLFAWGMTLGTPLAVVLVIATSTALALEGRWWPRGRYWIRTHWPMRRSA